MSGLVRVGTEQLWAAYPCTGDERARVTLLRAGRRHRGGAASVVPVSSIRLVTLTAEHVPALPETMRDPDVLRFTRTPHPMPAGWIHSWLERFDGQHRVAFAILDESGEFAGYAVSGPIDREGLEVELGYAVAPHARGRGFATATLLELTRWAFEQGMKRVTALISVENPASSRVAEKAGYRFEGVLRSWSILPDEFAAPSSADA